MKVRINKVMILIALFVLISTKSFAHIIPASHAKTGEEIVVVYIVHKVKKEDYLSKIAEFWGVKLDKILKENRLNIHDKIHPGQKIKVPTGLIWGKVFFYKVKKGDTILEIAHRYGAFPEQIFYDNNLTLRSLIYPGQVLKVAKVIVPKKEVVASWYGPGFDGRKAADGEKYNMQELTAAHRFLPLGIKLKVTYDNKCSVSAFRIKRTIIVKVTDRGPFILSREIDLSRRAAEKLIGRNFLDGVFKVTIESL